MERFRWLKFLHSLNGTTLRSIKWNLFALPAIIAFAGVYFKSPLFSVMGALWMIFELRIAFATPRFDEVRGGLQWLPTLLAKLGQANPESEKWLRDKVAASVALADSPQEKRWLTRLEDLSQLRSLVFDNDFAAKRFLDKTFAGSQVREGHLPPEFIIHPTSDDIMLSATRVARLYTALLDTCEAESEPLKKLAQSLFKSIFRENYDLATARRLILPLTDHIQKDGGIPYLMLSWVASRHWDRARTLARDLLTRDVPMVDEDSRSTLYWLTELGWFKENGDGVIGNFESTIRYLYHLCLTDPEKGGFLEIDSRFFSQFQNVNELAREGMLFKDGLIEKVLGLWGAYPGHFDTLFNHLLETMLQVRSKALRDAEAWASYWAREKEDFSQALLLTIEGNLSYADGQYVEANRFYEKALELEPELRAARLNHVFSLAFCGEKGRHLDAAEAIVEVEALYPTSYFVAGDSFLLLGQDAKAETFYAELRRDPQVADRVDFHLSVLLFDAGEYERALPFARAAHKRNPQDTTIRYHLSVCYDRVGEKDHALDLVKTLEEERKVEWLQFYRFTLERDSGRTEEALETLRQIPRNYFEDPEELEAALEFAKDSKDLALMRALRRQD